jgi:leucyl-tRNA synthetase
VQTDKRDYLVNIEHSVQKDWQEGHFFDADPPPLPEGVSSYAEFFETISKVEFAAGFERMRGKRVLFPVGYHATGMPIKAGHLTPRDPLR